MKGPVWLGAWAPAPAHLDTQDHLPSCSRPRRGPEGVTRQLPVRRSLKQQPSPRAAPEARGHPCGTRGLSSGHQSLWGRWGPGGLNQVPVFPSRLWDGGHPAEPRPLDQDSGQPRENRTQVLRRTCSSRPETGFSARQLPALADGPVVIPEGTRPLGAPGRQGGRNCRGCAWEGGSR